MNIDSLKKDREYSRQGSVWVGWGKEMGELAKEEAEYHDQFDEEAGDVHQLEAWRNVFYHRLLQNKIKELPKGGKVLEIGAGSGADAAELKNDYQLTLTDVSPKTLERLAKKLGTEGIDYIAVDGTNLPFVDNYFDGLYMVAVWHHFEDPDKGLNEALRVLKPGGQLVIGVEPNKTYFYWIKIFRSLLCKAVHIKADEGSRADAEMVGFSYGEIKQMFDPEKWHDITIRPMWLFAGWWHYFLEFIYRAFKLKKRIKLLLWLEKFIVGLDEALFKVPFVKYLCWHWIVSSVKR